MDCRFAIPAPQPRLPGYSNMPRLICLLALAVSMAPTALVCRADEESSVPGAPTILPQDTLAYIRVDDANDLREGFSESSLGKMISDPALRPFASDVYLVASELFEQVGSMVDVTLDELLSIPQGQVAFAAMPGNLSDEQVDAIDDEADDESPEAIRRRIARKRRQQNSIGALVLIEAGKNLDKLETIVNRLEARVIEDGYVRRTTIIDDVTLVKLLPPRSGRPEYEYFYKEGTLVLGSGHKTASVALDHWLERSEEATLAERADFTSVMSRCVGAEDTRPQITFFLDPYHIAERIVRRSSAGAIIWPIAQDLGIEKIRGIGGSTFRGGEFFDDISHLHVLVDPPRDGLFGVLRPESGDTAPPSWVPSDVTSYTTIHWDFPTTFENASKVVEGFGVSEPLVKLEDLSQRVLGVSAMDDIVALTTGRYVSLRWLEPPVKLNSQTQLYAFSISDELKAKDLMAKVRERMSNRIEVETVGGRVVYKLQRGRRGIPEGFRQPQPSIMILDGWLIFSDSLKLVERVALAQSGSLPQLVNLPEYELISGELGGKLDGEKPFMISFLQGADYVRQFYELAQGEDTKNFLRSAGQRNQIAAKMGDLLQRNELPPFEQFKKYFAPSGTFAYDESSGMHLGTFTLKPVE